MKSLLIALALILPQFAHAATGCSSAPNSQKLVWSNFQSYLQDRTDASADIYLGSLKQYMVDVTSSNYDWSLLEVGPLVSMSDPATSCLKNEINAFNAFLDKGDKSAIRLVVIYSTLDIADGAFGEALAATQEQITKKFASTLATVKVQNAVYLKAHPIAMWGY